MSSSIKKNIFDGLHIHILKPKLDPKEENRLKTIIENNGGNIERNQRKANLIITALRAPARVLRHIHSVKVPVIHKEWVDKSFKSGKRLNVDVSEYRLDFSNLVSTRPYEHSEPQAHTSSRETSDEEDAPLARGFLNVKYECQRPTPLIPRENHELIEQLEIIERAREVMVEEKRALSYRHAISALKAYPAKIKSYKEALKIRGVGSTIGEHIRVYLETGVIPEAEQLQHDERFKALNEFCGIFGVGAKTANVWYEQGHRTIDDIRQFVKLSSQTQRVGLELYEDFIKKLSRKDVEEITTIVANHLEAIDPQCVYTVVGGYRRGKELGGDVDMVISHPVDDVCEHLLSDILERLTDAGILKYKLWYGKPSRHLKGDILRYDSEETGRQSFDNLDKCFVAIRQPSTGIYRQLDIIVAFPSEYATAIVGWTGSRQFERSLKAYATKEKRMIFASHGLFTDTQPRERIPIRSERELFEVLGLPWIEPEYRNC
ncbi:uncharacterized protein VTP21DRAFT_7336 [Calcarisporiella thermophila]|uniref:uncharacterized protein n=1 Tax=Calcarisporiella thermophila TaxID=911321 RepID=UPI0037443573